MGTKLQNVTKDPNPRVVFVSCKHDEPFSIRVRDSLRGKLDRRYDRADRPIEVYDRRDRASGDENAVLPWEKTPTDVVVLLSDRYLPDSIGREPIADGATSPELNFVLRLREKDEPPPYQVWFGVVQNTLWKNIGIEGGRLERFLHVLHELRPQYIAFSKQVEVIDDEAAEAAVLITDHLTTSCQLCSGRAGPAAAGTAAPEQTPPPTAASTPARSVWSRLFGGKG